MQLLSIYRYKGNGELLTIIIVFSLISISVITAVVGIGFQQGWAKKLYFYSCIIAFATIFGSIIISLMVNECLDVYPLIIAVISFAPWLATLSYGMYYIHRKDVGESLGSRPKKDE